MNRNADRIITVPEEKVYICRFILEALPDWFGIDEARENYIHTVLDQIMFATFANNKPIGFISLKTHNSWNAEIFVMGVLPNWHQQGIGKKLVACAVEFAKQNSIQFLTVKTLSALSSDTYYVKTRLFYEGCGFQPFEEFPDLWGEDNPCTMMIKAI